MTEMIFQMIAALILVLLLIFVFAFVYRKRNRGAGLIRMISYQSLGQKMGIVALKIGEEVMVFGITPTDLKLLKRFEGQTINLQETGIGDQGPIQSLFTGTPGTDESGSSAGGTPAKGGVAGALETLRKIKEDIHG